MSMMQTTVRLAVATAIAAAAAQSASANDISTYVASGSNATINVYLSGSTAVDNTLLNAAIETAAPGGMCAPGTVDVYYVGTNSSYSNRMILCTGSATSGASGKSLALYKESVVGSANGASPLYLAAEGQPSGASFINPTAISDTACPTVNSHNASGDFSTYTDHSGCPAADETANVIPSAGFADVEAAILRTSTGSTLDANATSTYLTGTGTLDQVWAVALTVNAYQAIQAAEGLTVNDLAVNAPSLTRSEIAGLVSGDVFQWSDLGIPAPADDQVYICRRDDGSGTEASFEAYFTGARCTIGDQIVLAEDGASSFANGSAGNVRKCLQNVFAGGVQPLYYSSGSHTFTGGGYAIGFQNTEITLANFTAVGSAFRLVAVDGVGPTVANVQNGYYPYFSTGVSYTITSEKSGVTGAVLAAPQLAVVTALQGKLAAPAFVADSNTNYNGVIPWSSAPRLTTGDVTSAQPGLPNGNVAPPVPATSASASTNPQNVYTKNLTGKINNCDIPVWDSADLEGVVTGTVEKNLLGTGQVNQ